MGHDCNHPAMSWFAGAHSLGHMVFPTKNPAEETQHKKLKTQRRGGNHAHQQLPWRKLHRQQPENHECWKQAGRNKEYALGYPSLCGTEPILHLSTEANID